MSLFRDEIPIRRYFEEFFAFFYWMWYNTKWFGLCPSRACLSVARECHAGWAGVFDREE